MAGDDFLKNAKKGGDNKAGAAHHGKSSGKNSSVGGFQSMGLTPPVFRAVMALGYKVPTPIQRKTLPIVLSGRDCVAMARTGSGKTAAFLIPMLEHLKEHSTRVGVRAIILSPTRELAVQTLRFAKQLAKFTSVQVSLIVGGDGMEAQFEALASNPDVLVATPGRLMHHLQEIPDFSLSSVEYLVFDEADRMFEMGFAEQLQEILSTVPSSRQTLLFSATLPKALVQFARAGLRDPELIRLDVENKISENLKMAFFTVRSDDKPALFVYLVRQFLPKDDQTIIFAATRHHVELLHELLKANDIESSCVYGDMDPASRKINIGKFRSQKTKLLIVTDVAARGIDIPLLNNVLNYSFPSTAKLFVHRVGRAARAGRSGTAFSFVDPDEVPFMVDLHLYIGRRLEDSSPAKTEGYHLRDMQVEDVHYGSFPNDLIDQESEQQQYILHHHPQVEPLVKVVANAHKMYARTRADPAKNSIRRARDVDTKQLHPLFKKEYLEAPDKADKAQYIASLQTFRPSQTIFEVGIGAHSAKKTSPGAVMMQTKRKHHEKIIQTELNKANGVEEPMPEVEDKNEAKQEQVVEVKQDAEPIKAAFLSKHDRKQLKKRVAAGEKEEDVKQELLATKESVEKKDTFKDDGNYISAVRGDEETEGFLANANEGGKTNASYEARLEEAVLDVNPDEAIEMNKKRRVLHWDTRKKKYVKTSVGEISSSGKIKRRNESGAAVKKKHQTGELYKKWQQRQHKKVNTGGEEDGDGPRMDYRNGKKPAMARVNKNAKDELMGEKKIRKEEARKARSRGVKVSSKSKSKRGKGNVKGKSHGAPTRSKAIIRR